MTSAAVRAQIAGDDVANLLKSITIPPCPAVVSTLLAESRRDDIDFNRIARLIAGDVSLAASMIKTANSPFFGLRRKVESVPQAVAVLGLKNILGIVAGLALRRAVSPPGVSMERFWERSSLHAVACARLARRQRGVSREDAYTYGLFHDCGIPILMQRFPDYKDTLAQANQSARPMVEVEFERHATSHVVVGAMLARNWQLPDIVARAIAAHHDFGVLREEGGDTPAEVVALSAVSLVAEHLVARFLGYREEAEWLCWGAEVLIYLGLGGDEYDDLYDEIADELTEVQAARQ